MEDLLRQAWLIGRGMWLHRRIGLAFSWIFGLVAAVAVFMIPDKYEASARIFVDTDSVLRPLLSGLVVQANTEQQVAMLSRTLINRPNVEKVIRMADLDLGIKSAEAREALIERLTKELKIKSAGRDNLYTLEYRDSDPEKARRVVQALTTIFVESNLGTKRSDTDTAKKFIEEQIEQYRKKLEEAEARLKEFKLRNIEFQLDSNRGADVRITELGAQLNDARLALREAENSRDALKRQLAGEEPVLLPDLQPGAESAISLPEIDGRIDVLKRNLDQLLQKYTEQHPDVTATRRLIKDLEEQKRQEIEARKKAAKVNPAAAPLNANPAYQQMKVSLAEAEAQVAALRARVGEYEARYRQALEKLKLAPQVEAEYAQLTRDYGILKKNYDDLVARRESASLSEGMTSVASVADFRLIDPPRASHKPVWPNRLVFLSLALLASLGLGLAVSFIASQLRPAFFDTRTLRDVTGLPLLGAVSLIPTPEGERLAFRQKRNFVIGLSALIAVYLVAMAVAYVIIERAT